MYVLDANVFITAHREYYSFNIAPSFWATLIKMATESRLCSIDKIKSEIIVNKPEDADNLQKWTTENFRNYFERTDSADVINWYGQIQGWAIGNVQFTPSAKEEFARNADAWLIAYAKARGFTLVTLEVLNRTAKNKIFIPTVCEQFGVRYVNTFKMLEELGIQF